MVVANQASHQERLLKACGEIAQELIQNFEAGRLEDINLNGVKIRASKKYRLASQPRLMDIIAAIPDQHRKYLLPKLKAKPVRTASGIAVVAVMCKPHRCPHIAMTGNICVYVCDRHIFLSHSSNSALVVPIQISNTLPNHTLATNLLQCGRSGPVTIHTSRLEVVWNSCEDLDILWIRWNTLSWAVLS